MGPQGRVQTGSRLNRLGLILYIGCDRFFLHFFISLLSLFFLSQNCSLLSLIFSDQQRKIRRGGRPLWTAAPPPETTKKRTPFFKKKFSPFLLVFFLLYSFLNSEFPKLLPKRLDLRKRKKTTFWIRTNLIRICEFWIGGDLQIRMDL